MEEEIDFIYIMELAEKNRNLQCYKCSGWAVNCPCEDNQFSKSEKEDFRKVQ